MRGSGFVAAALVVPVWFVILVAAVAVTVIGLVIMLPFIGPRRRVTRTQKLMDITKPAFAPEPTNEAATFTPSRDVVPEGLGAGIMRRHHSPVSDPRVWSEADIKLFQECERGIRT